MKRRSFGGGMMAAALCALAVTAGGRPAAADVTASAQVDRAQLAVGESAVLSIAISGSQDAAAPELGAIDGFGVRYVGPATEMRFENGRMSSSVTHRYQLIARKPGRFSIGPFETTVDGTAVRTEPLVLEVVPAGRAAAAGQAPQLGIEVRLARSDPFVGERVPLTIKVLIPANVRVDDLQFPTVEADSIAVGAMPQPTQRDEQIGGRPHRVLYFDTHLTPLAAASSSLTVAMQMNVLETRRGNRGGVFGMFGDMLAERRPVELRSRPLDFAPRGLPPGHPPSYSGAVGQYDLEVSASPLSVNAGDPVTLRITVAGDGDLSKVHPPQFEQIDGFRVYDAVAVKDAGDGRRVVEQVVIPQSPDADELPALAFSYFDPAGETYRTVHRGPIALSVGAASSLPSGVVAEGETGRPERAQGPLGRDIVYIKNAPGRWRAVDSSWLASPLFWLLNIVPGVACGLLWWRNRRADQLAANPALRRFRNAETTARQALSRLAADAGSGGNSFDQLARVLGEFLGAKLGLPPGAIEGAAVGRELRAAGYGEELCREGESLIAALEGLRYAPAGAGEIDRRALLARAESLVAGVERRKDLTDKLARSLLAMLAFAVLLTPALVGRGVAADAGADGGEARFFAGNHAYADARYADAVSEYEAALAAGEESGALHFNLGNARFKRGDTAAALASYLRAERVLPRDPDVAANLSFARESLELGEDRDPLWQRVAFALAYRASELELVALVTVLWWLWCGVAATGLAVPRLREALRWPLRIGAALAVIGALNLVYRHQMLELRDQAIVVAAAGTPVRFGPSADGTEHFAAPAGTRLRIDEERDGWLQVERRDGRRGWVVADAVTRLR